MTEAEGEANELLAEDGFGPDHQLNRVGALRRDPSRAAGQRRAHDLAYRQFGRTQARRDLVEADEFRSARLTTRELGW